MNKGKIIWSDEFERSGEPSSDNWFAETGGYGWGNNEKQMYTDNKNARIEYGYLVIESRREVSGSMTQFYKVIFSELTAFEYL